MPRRNVEMIKVIAKGLEELNNKVVYVGGTVTEFYSSNRFASEDIRQTEDVDVVIEIESRSSFQNLEEKLRIKGFVNDTSGGAPICRWIYEGIKLDVMADDSTILGFSNKWYKPGIKNKQLIEIDENTTIYIFPVVYYLASKFEAISGRGGSDLRGSHDFEDVIFIFNNCDDILEQVETSQKNLRKYVSDFFEKISKDINFREAVSCCLPYGSEDRADDIIAQINILIKGPN